MSRPVTFPALTCAAWGPVKQVAGPSSLVAIPLSFKHLFAFELVLTFSNQCELCLIFMSRFCFN